MFTVEGLYHKLDKELAIRIKSMASASSSNPQSSGLALMHGTTDLALVYNSGVLVATDGRATAGNVIVTDTFAKIMRLDRHSVIAIAGAPSVGIEIVKLLRAQINFEADNTESYIPPKTKVNMIVKTMKKYFPLALSHNMIVQLILGTYDTDSREPGGRVFNIHPDGSVPPETDFTCIGSGGQIAKTIIQLLLDVNRLKCRDMSLDQAMRLAVAGLHYANLWDSATGSNVFMRMVTSESSAVVSRERIDSAVADVKEGRIL